MRNIKLALAAFTVAGLATLPLASQEPSSNPTPAQPAAPAQPSPQAGANSSAAPSSANSPDAANLQLSPVVGELVNKLDSKSAKTGDQVVVKTTEKATTADGVEIPKGSKIVGHVVDVTAHDNGIGGSHGFRWIVGWRHDRKQCFAHPERRLQFNSGRAFDELLFPGFDPRQCATGGNRSGKAGQRRSQDHGDPWSADRFQRQWPAVCQCVRSACGSQAERSPGWRNEGSPGSGRSQQQAKFESLDTTSGFAG